MGGATVALSRTDPRPDGNTIREVEHLFEDAIAAADRLIYVETQYSQQPANATRRLPGACFDRTGLDPRSSSS